MLFRLSLQPPQCGVMGKSGGKSRWGDGKTRAQCEEIRVIIPYPSKAQRCPHSTPELLCARAALRPEHLAAEVRASSDGDLGSEAGGQQQFFFLRKNVLGICIIWSSHLATHDLVDEFGNRLTLLCLPCRKCSGRHSCHGTIE